MMIENNRKDLIMKTSDTKLSSLIATCAATANAGALAFGIYLMFVATI